MTTLKTSQLTNTRMAVADIKDPKLRSSFKRLISTLERSYVESHSSVTVASCLRAIVSLGINLQNVLGKRQASDVCRGALLDASDLGISLPQAGLSFKPKKSACLNYKCRSGNTWCVSDQTGCAGGGTPWPR